jgi:hypothetical protein
MPIRGRTMNVAPDPERHSRAREAKPIRGEAYADSGARPNKTMRPSYCMRLKYNLDYM